MNYYEELLNKIENYLSENQIELARDLINNELKQAYVPRDINEKLIKYLSEIGPKEENTKKISDEDIISYLSSTNERQLIAVDALNKRNLREYIDICNEYLSNDGFINAKVLLIDSLIRQEISETITYNNNGLKYEFIPKYVLPIEESDGFIYGIKHLEDVYLKEPSKLKMAKELLFKEFIMLLPINQDENEGINIANKIIKYIDKAFE